MNIEALIGLVIGAAVLYFVFIRKDEKADQENKQRDAQTAVMSNSSDIAQDLPEMLELLLRGCQPGSEYWCNIS